MLNYLLLLVELWHRCGGDLLIELPPHLGHVAGGTRAYRTGVAGGRPNKTAWSDHLVHFMWEDTSGKKMSEEMLTGYEPSTRSGIPDGSCARIAVHWCPSSSQIDTVIAKKRGRLASKINNRKHNDWCLQRKLHLETDRAVLMHCSFYTAMRILQVIAVATPCQWTWNNWC
jgi:hypothetical protein